MKRLLVISEVFAIIFTIITSIWEGWGDKDLLSISYVLWVGSIIIGGILIYLYLKIGDKSPYIQFKVPIDSFQSLKEGEEGQITIFSPIQIMNEGVKAENIKAIIEWDGKKESIEVGKLLEGKSRALNLNSILNKIPKGEGFTCMIKYMDEITFKSYYSKISVEKGKKVKGNRFLLILDAETYEYGMKPFYKFKYTIKKRGCE